ncbi:MAG: diaminopimelate decarboxylase [Clostridiales bacterium]|nr:diaminopimelate decarboxylase [Clostridiales bacterium]
MSNRLNSFTHIEPTAVIRAKKKYGTPLYLYDEKLIIEKCRALLSMPHAYGLVVRYAMKANSNRALLRCITEQGIEIDASSLNEVRRAGMAGIGMEKIILTTQEVPEGEDRKELELMMLRGLKYNVCSLRQLYLIGDFARHNNIDLSIRVHPGIGSGESASRNTGDKYSCFGIHMSDIKKALDYAKEKGIRFNQVHVHIGSGADPEMWRQNIDLELGIVEKYFPDAETVSFGGGLKEARMPGETTADLADLGGYANKQIEGFYEKTGRKLKMEVEPGTYIVANSGYAVTKVIDKKRTGENGFNFIVLDGGMEINARPLMYGSQHPFYVISKDGRLLFSEFSEGAARDFSAVVVGKCCETGDSQCLDSQGNIVPRIIGEPDIGDIVVIGGVGAYCASMTPFNYNSHTQAPEVLYTKDGELKLIRAAQTLEQLIANEI